MWGLVGSGLRQARRESAFYAFVVACLGLGVGTSTAVFTVTDAALFRPLDFPDAHRLAYVTSVAVGPGGDAVTHAVSPARFVEIRDRTEAFESLDATWTENFDLIRDGGPIRLAGVRATPGLFATLGVVPVAGRMLMPDDAGSLVVLLSESAWHRLFGGDPAVVNTMLELNGLSREVVGIVPDRQAFPSSAEVWVPYRPEDAPLSELHSGGLEVVGRLAEGFSLQASNADMDRVERFTAELYPASSGERRASVQELREPFVAQGRGTLLALLASVLVFLAATVVNVAGLFAVRSGRQAKTIAVRSALGASRGMIVRSGVVEGLSVAVVSGLVGAVAAAYLVPWLARSNVGLPPGGVPTLVRPSVALFAMAFVLMTAAVCAVGPVLVSIRVVPASALRSGGGGATMSAAQKRAQGLVITVQTILGVVLVLSAGAGGDRLLQLRSVDPGFGHGQVLSVRIPISEERFPTLEQRSDLVHRVAQGLRAIPGVGMAGGVDILPIGDGNVLWSHSVEDQPPDDLSMVEFASGRLITPGYLEAAGITLVRGRTFSESDRQGAPPVVLVSESFAERYWPEQDPIGRRIKRRAYDSPFPWLTVIGMVSDVRDGGPAFDRGITIYLPYAQQDTRLGREMSFVVRSDRTQEDLLSEVRSRVAAADPLAPILRIRTLADLLTESMSVERTSSNVLGGFALGGLLLLGIGLFGVMSRTVLERRREIGLRRALGARSIEAIRLVLRSGAVPVLAGTITGLSVGPLIVGMSGAFLGETLAVPYWAYAVAGVLVLSVGAVAGLLPTLKAVRVSPVISLRSE